MIFAYLYNVEENKVNGTLQTFVEQYIGQQACLHDHLYRRVRINIVQLLTELSCA